MQHYKIKQDGSICTTFTSTNISDLDEFGFAVAYSDNRIFVGSPKTTQ